MPTYDYQCETCGHRFEARQSMKDPHLTDCPQDSCQGPVKRLIGAGSGFIFKGNGFYITDYRSESYKAAAKKDAAAGSGSAPASSPPPSSGSSSAGSSAS
jgi:putative FmdB family regulatory protein